MMSVASQVIGSPSRYSAMRKFAVRKPAEFCSLCRVEIEAHHSHLVDPVNRQIFCACSNCQHTFGEIYRTIPTRVQLLDDFDLADSQWDALMIPINIAFFVRRSAGIVAVYPSPAGPIESPISADHWREIENSHSVLQNMASDVEALLVNRLGAAKGHEGTSYFVVPIDECFRLVGLIRTHWRGLSGGTEVWRAISIFFSEMKERSCHS
jgi:hypothetical protein